MWCGSVLDLNRCSYGLNFYEKIESNRPIISPVLKGKKKKRNLIRVTIFQGASRSWSCMACESTMTFILPKKTREYPLLPWERTTTYGSPAFWCPNKLLAAAGECLHFFSVMYLHMLFVLYMCTLFVKMFHKTCY